MSRFMKGVKLDHDRIAKLPTWAQGLITVLEGRLREADRAFEEVSGKVGETRVVVDPYGSARFCLPEDSTVRFMFGDDDYVDVRLDRQQDEVLQVHGRHCLQVHPRAANVIHITDDKSL